MKHHNVWLILFSVSSALVGVSGNSYAAPALEEILAHPAVTLRVSLQ